MERKLELFKWDEKTTPLYFSLYFTRFERLMRLSQIIVAETEHDVDLNTIVIDNLITIGGNDLLQRIMEIKDYETLSYLKSKSELEKSYTCQNIKVMNTNSEK